MITVTRRTKNASSMIQEALANGHHVMAYSPNAGVWFRVNFFKEENGAWYATPFSHGHLSGSVGPIQVRTITWQEQK